MAAKTKVWHKPDEQTPKITQNDQDLIICHLVDGSLISCAWCGKHFHVCIPFAPDGFDGAAMAPPTIIEWAYKRDLLADGGTALTEEGYCELVEKTAPEAQKWMEEMEATHNPNVHESASCS